MRGVEILVKVTPTAGKGACGRGGGEGFCFEYGNKAKMKLGQKNKHNDVRSGIA